jgi:hypothetical protein
MRDRWAKQELLPVLAVAALPILIGCGDSTAPDPALNTVWTSVATLNVSGRGGSLAGIWGSGPNDIWVVGGDGTLHHYNGTTWSVEATGSTVVRAVWARSPTDVWAVGSGETILHYDGTKWSTMSTSSSSDSFNSVWTGSASDVWAGRGADPVTSVGATVHYDGSSVSESYVALASSSIAVWGASPSDVWAVGFAGRTGSIHSGSITHYDGSSWSSAVPTVSRMLVGIWGSSGSFIVAVGGDYVDGTGVVLTYDGKDWSTSWTGAGLSGLVSVWGTSATNVWAVGDVVLHFDGKRWSTVPSPTTATVRGVWTSSPGDVWAVAGNEVFHGALAP